MPPLDVTAGLRTITATDQSKNSINDLSNVTVNPGPPDHFTLTVPATAQINTAFNTHVVVKDQFANTVTSYAGTAHFSSSGVPATLPSPDYQFLSADMGQHNFTVTPGNTPGGLTLNVNDTVSTGVVGTASLTVATDASISAKGKTIRLFRDNVPVVVASFMDGDLGETNNPMHLTATINWGDGTPLDNGQVVHVGPVNGENTFNVVGNHAYAKKGRFNVTVTMTDSGGATQTANSTAQFFPRNFSF